MFVIFINKLPLKKQGSDELGWAKSAGPLEDTVRAARQKVVAA